MNIEKPQDKGAVIPIGDIGPGQARKITVRFDPPKEKMLLAETICKADQRGIFERALLISKEIPECMRHEEMREFYAKEAKLIADVLWECLPGGTVDALLVEMLDRKRTLLKVAHKE